MTKPTSAIAFPLIIFICLIGCGGKSSMPIFAVKGVLKIDGKPIPDVEIQLMPIDSNPNSLVAMGRSNKDGKFSVAASNGKQGAAKGKYKVVLFQSSSDEQKVVVNHGQDNPQAWLEQQKNYLTQKAPDSRKSAEGDKKKGIPVEFTKKETSPRVIEVVDRALDLELDL